MAYATPSDVAVELGRPFDSVSEAEKSQWTLWLDRVERTIRRRFTREGYVLDEQVGLGRPAAEDVQDVVIARVVDKIQNPNTRQSSYTKSVDDASATIRYEGANAGDPLLLTDDEWASLLPARPNRPKAFSVMPS